VSWLVADPEDKRRRGKNWALLGILIALAALLYVVTIVRLGMLP
jgi:hypothetical protein